MQASSQGSTSEFSRRLVSRGMFLIPVLVVLSPNGSYWSLVIGGGIALLAFAKGSLVPPRWLRPLFFWILIFLAWAAASCLWTIEPPEGATRLAKLAVFSGFGLCLLRLSGEYTDRDRTTAGNSLMIGVALLVVGLAVEAGTLGAISLWLTREIDVRPTSVANLMSTAVNGFALLALPLAVWLRRNGPPPLAHAWILFALQVLAFAAALYFHHTGTAIVVVAGAVIFAAGWLWPRLSAAVLGLVFVILVLAAPLIGKAVAPGPWITSLPRTIQFPVYHRTTVWSFVAQRIDERPLTGWGLEAARRLPGGDTTITIAPYLGFAENYQTTARLMPLHPHNAALQVWLELGLVGALLAAALVAGCAFAIGRWRTAPEFRAAALASFAIAMALSLTSFSIWHSHWFAMLWLIAFTVMSLAPPRQERTPAAPGGGTASP